MSGRRQRTKKEVSQLSVSKRLPENAHQRLTSKAAGRLQERIAVAGHKNHVRHGPGFSERQQDLVALHPWHHEVDCDDRRRILLDQGKEFDTVPEHVRFVPTRLGRTRDDVRDLRLVVENRDARARTGTAANVRPQCHTSPPGGIADTTPSRGPILPRSQPGQGPADELCDMLHDDGVTRRCRSTAEVPRGLSCDEIGDGSRYSTRSILVRRARPLRPEL